MNSNDVMELDMDDLSRVSGGTGTPEELRRFKLNTDKSHKQKLERNEPSEKQQTPTLKLKPRPQR